MATGDCRRLRAGVLECWWLMTVHQGQACLLVQLSGVLGTAGWHRQRCPALHQHLSVLVLSRPARRQCLQGFSSFDWVRRRFCCTVDYGWGHMHRPAACTLTMQACPGSVLHVTSVSTCCAALLQPLCCVYWHCVARVGDLWYLQAALVACVSCGRLRWPCDADSVFKLSLFPCVYTVAGFCIWIHK